MTQESSTAADHPAGARPVSRTRVFLISGLGTALEYYDFIIYGIAAAIVFPIVFFPDSDPLVGTLIAFATFGVGFLARPLGGLIFGHLGDRVGRKPVLITTLVVMGIATALIGFLPSYSAIGIWAPILLVVLRLVQGFAAGGEWGGAALFGLESAPARRRGLWAGFTSMGVALGGVLGGAVFALVGALAGAGLIEFAWRIPFWIGGALVVAGLIARRAIPHESSPASAKGSRPPLIEVLRSRPRAVLLALVASLAYNTLAYVGVYALSFATQHGIAADQALLLQFISGPFMIVFVPLAALASDRFGRRPIVVIGCVLMAIMLIVFFPLLETGSFLIALLAFVGFSTFLTMALGPLPSLLGEQFPRHVRYSGLSLAYQFGAAIGGGTSATVAAALVLAFGGSSLGVSIYMIVMCLILGIVTLAMRETAFLSMDEINAAVAPRRTAQEAQAGS